MLSINLCVPMHAHMDCVCVGVCVFVCVCVCVCVGEEYSGKSKLY